MQAPAAGAAAAAAPGGDGAKKASPPLQGVERPVGFLSHLALARCGGIAATLLRVRRLLPYLKANEVRADSALRNSELAEVLGALQNVSDPVIAEPLDLWRRLDRPQWRSHDQSLFRRARLPSLV